MGTRFCSDFGETLPLQLGAACTAASEDPYFEECCLTFILRSHCYSVMFQWYSVIILRIQALLHLILPSQQLSTCTATDIKSLLPAGFFFFNPNLCSCYSYAIVAFEPWVPVANSCILKSLSTFTKSPKTWQNSPVNSLAFYHVLPVLQGKGLKESGPEYRVSKNTVRDLSCFKFLFFFFLIYRCTLWSRKKIHCLSDIINYIPKPNYKTPSAKEHYKN